MVIYPQFLQWDTTGGVHHALSTSSAFGDVRIQLTDPTTNVTLQVAADFATLLTLFYICFISVLYLFSLRGS